MQLKEIKKIFHEELGESYPTEEIDSFFYLLIEHHFDMERFVLALRPDLTLSKHEEAPLFRALAQLKDNKPIQYIIGSTTFMDMVFKVNDNVLIPRPETEELVRWVIDEFSTVERPRESSTTHVLDIGTGSGCIAVALAKNLIKPKVMAVDVSTAALGVAQENALSNQVDIDFRVLDILETGTYVGHFDIIISNPPYVREMEKRAMHKNVLDYEPGGALFVTDEDPLVFYRAIIRFSEENLAEKGRLFLEINQYLAEATMALLRQHNFSEIELRKDMFGKNRFIKCSHNP